MSAARTDAPYAAPVHKYVSTRTRIFTAALEAFAELGYQGASLRDIAKRVGIEVGSLYNHISSKEELLFQLIEAASHDLIGQLRERAAVVDDPVDRLLELVRTTIVYHAEHGSQSFVGYGELRALTPEHREQAMGWRREMEQTVKDCLQACVQTGRLPAGTDLSVSTNFIVGMATSPSTWFSATGPRTPDEVADVAGQILHPWLDSATS
jgi:TetR/AcrR family transcriptional regulator, cholesterol catabolism regulator